MTSPSRVPVDLRVRPYEAADEPCVLELLSASLGAGWTREGSEAFFRWKHLENPFGRSFLLVAEVDGRIVGLRAFLRWRFRTEEGHFPAVRAVDTATHPDFQGSGIFSRLTLAAIDTLRNEVGLIFNTPNDRSGPGYLKMGWREVGSVPVLIGVRRPVVFVRNVRTLRSEESSSPARRAPEIRASRACEVLADDLLLERTVAVDEPTSRLATQRSPRYLRWRYGSGPGLDYRAVRLDDAPGLAVFRVRPRGALWESTVVEVLVSPGDVRATRRLLAAVRRAADVDHLTIHLPPHTAARRAARRGVFLRAPGGILLVANPLSPLSPDPMRLESWSLSLGDLEVF
jgi:GNAT superfamily N-acetyltransferase